jgi:hypothetical protein
VRELCSCDLRDALAHLDKTGLYSPALSALTTSAGISRGAPRRSETESGSQISVGEKEKSVPLELVESKPLEHPALLQYLAKLGIDHDIVRQHLSQIDFKAPQGAWNYFARGGLPAGEVFVARNALFKGSCVDTPNPNTAMERILRKWPASWSRRRSK